MLNNWIESQHKQIDICRDVDEKRGDNRNKFPFNDYPMIGFPRNRYYYCTNRESEVDGSDVIDDEMKEHLQMVLDEMKSQSERDRTNNL
jgi:hypothetical protein